PGVAGLSMSTSSVTASVWKTATPGPPAVSLWKSSWLKSATLIAAENAHWVTARSPGSVVTESMVIVGAAARLGPPAPRRRRCAQRPMLGNHLVQAEWSVEKTAVVQLYLHEDTVACDRRPEASGVRREDVGGRGGRRGRHADQREIPVKTAARAHLR